MVNHPHTSPQRQWVEARPKKAIPRRQQSHLPDGSTQVTAVNPLMWAKAIDLLGKTRSCANGVRNKLDREAGVQDGMSSGGSCIADDCSNQDGISEVAGANNSSPASISQVAAVKRELKALEQRYFRMREQLEKAREQVSKT